MREKDPISTFQDVISQVASRYPNLSYIHLVEPVIAGDKTKDQQDSGDNNDFARKIWQPRPLIVAGGHTPESGKQVAEEKGGLVAYGRLFIANVSGP